MSIFSRVKKPALVEPKPPVDTGRPREGGALSSPGAAAKGEGNRLAPELPAPPKANGIAAAVKPAEPSVAPAPPHAPKPNGVTNGRGVFAVPAPPAAPKLPGPSTTPVRAAAPARAVAERSPAPEAAKTATVLDPQDRSPDLDPQDRTLDLVIDMALEAGAFEGEVPAIVADGSSTASDQAALRATFEDVAVPYMAEVRGIMIELKWGETRSSWFELARPLLHSLRKMAVAVGESALVEALDRFDKAVGEVLAPGQPASPSPAARDALLTAYDPLLACLPQAFELEGERDRREPLIVRALLEQVPGLEPVMLETLVAVGFGKLSALYAARADEIAAVTGLGDLVAAAIAARIQAFRRATPAGLASVDQRATLGELERLLKMLRTQNGAFDAVARGWSDQDRSAKQQVRRARQLTLSQIMVELVRLGEVALVERLEKLSFAGKVVEVERFLGQALQTEKTKNRAGLAAPAAAALAT